MKNAYVISSDIDGADLRRKKRANPNYLRCDGVGKSESPQEVSKKVFDKVFSDEIKKHGLDKDCQPLIDNYREREFKNISMRLDHYPSPYVPDPHRGFQQGQTLTNINEKDRAEALKQDRVLAGHVDRISDIAKHEAEKATRGIGKMRTHGDDDEINEAIQSIGKLQFRGIPAQAYERIFGGK